MKLKTSHTLNKGKAERTSNKLLSKLNNKEA
jgi:hypothetical protein